MGQKVDFMVIRDVMKGPSLLWYTLSQIYTKCHIKFSSYNSFCEEYNLSFVQNTSIFHFRPSYTIEKLSPFVIFNYSSRKRNFSLNVGSYCLFRYMGPFTVAKLLKKAVD